MKNNPSISRLLCMLISVAACGSAMAATVITDDFNRADTDWTNTGSAIGTGWVIGGGAEWRIYSQQLQKNASEATNQTIWNTAVYFNLTETPVLEVSGSINCGSSNAWGGLVFNLQDASNYYVVRYKTSSNQFQFLCYVNGAPTVIASATADTNFSANTWYQISVSYTENNTYKVSISGGNIDISGEYSTSVYTSGYAGFFANTPGASFDNFSASVVPESSALSMVFTATMVALGIGVGRRARAKKTRKNETANQEA